MELSATERHKIGSLGYFGVDQGVKIKGGSNCFLNITICCIKIQD